MIFRENHADGDDEDCNILATDSSNGIHVRDDAYDGESGSRDYQVNSPGNNHVDVCDEGNGSENDYGLHSGLVLLQADVHAVNANGSWPDRQEHSEE